MKKPPKLTARQLNVYEVINNNRRAWVAMIVMLSLFTIGFFTFLYLVITRGDITLASGVVGGIDTLMLGLMYLIYRHLFPSKGSA